MRSGLDDWDRALAGLGDEAMAAQRPTHWGGSLPLSAIVAMVAQHVVYHSGEMNMLLSMARQEAWEYSEEVEENHIDTSGHGVRPPWMSDEEAHRYEAARCQADGGTG